MTGPDPYPESEKLRGVSVERHAIIEFIEWAGNRLANAGSSEVDRLVMEFFDIDPDKLEQERREMLKKMGEEG